MRVAWAALFCIQGDVVALKRTGANATPMRLSLRQSERLLELASQSPVITHRQALRMIADAEREAGHVEVVLGWRGVWT